MLYHTIPRYSKVGLVWYSKVGLVWYSKVGTIPPCWDVGYRQNQVSQENIHNILIQGIKEKSNFWRHCQTVVVQFLLQKLENVSGWSGLFGAGSGTKHLTLATLATQATQANQANQANQATLANLVIL